MTPEEANLIKELFDRLNKLESAQRDREAEALIQDGLQYAPHAPYALVQTVLVQDEALKRANARIQELEGGGGAGAETPRDTSFLGSMRDSLFGRRESRGSVPSVSSEGTGGGMSSAWQQGGAPPMGGPFGGGRPSGSYGGPQSEAYRGPSSGPYGGQPMPPPGTGGGSFLGTAAATAAGMVGGSLLLSSIRSMMGHGGTAHAAYNPPGGTPWGGSAAGGELSRDAGLDDIGRSQRSSLSQAGGDGGGFGGDDQGVYGGDGSSDDDFDDGGDDFGDGGGDDE